MMMCCWFLAYSEIFPGDTNVSTLLTKNIKLNIPFVSASMDTVTEHKLAIAIALKGGIGIIHKNMTIRNQAEQIRQSEKITEWNDKRSHNFRFSVNSWRCTNDC